MLKLALLTILIFVVLRLVAGWIGPGLIQWFAGPRAQFGIQDTKFLFGLGSIIFGLVSVFVVENLPTALARRSGFTRGRSFQPNQRPGHNLLHPCRNNPDSFCNNRLLAETSGQIFTGETGHT